MIPSYKRITNSLSSLRVCAGWSAPLLFANLRRQVFWRRGIITPTKIGIEYIRIAFPCTFCMRISSRNLQHWERMIPYFRFKYVRRCVFAYMVATPVASTVSLVSCDSRCSVAHPACVVGWFAVCDCCNS